MSRRPLALLALSLVTLVLSACSDSTAPTSSATQRQIQPSVQPFNDACAGGTMDSTGKC